MEQLKAKWTAEARKEAWAEARKEALTEACEAALRMKLSFEDVSKITGLSIEKIAMLNSTISHEEGARA